MKPISERDYEPNDGRERTDRCWCCDRIALGRPTVKDDREIFLCIECAGKSPVDWGRVSTPEGHPDHCALCRRRLEATNPTPMTEIIQAEPMAIDCELPLPICLTNTLATVFIVHVYAPDGGIVGLGECYHPSREAADNFASGVVRDLPRYRCAVAEYVRVAPTPMTAVMRPHAGRAVARDSKDGESEE